MISENEKQTDWRYGWRFRLFNAKSAVATETLFFEPKLIKFGENSLWPAFFYILGNKIHSNKHCLAMNVSYCVVRQRSSAEHKDAFNMEMSVRCIFDSLIVDVYGCRNRAHSHVMTIFDMVITFLMSLWQFLQWKPICEAHTIYLSTSKRVKPVCLIWWGTLRTVYKKKLLVFYC